MQVIGRLPLVTMRKSVVLPGEWRTHVHEKSKEPLEYRALGDLYLRKAELEGSKSLRELRSRLRHSHPTLGPGLVAAAWDPIDPAEIRTEDVVGWLRALALTGRADNTRLVALYVHSAVLNYGVELGCLERNPCKDIPKKDRPKKRPRDPSRRASEVLDVREVSALLSCPEQPMSRRLSWHGLLLTGLRWGEMAGLDWSAVGRHRKPLGEIVVSRTWCCRERRMKTLKTDQPRRIPIHPLLDATLDWSVDLYRRSLGRSPEADDPVFPFAFRAGRPCRWHENTSLRWWRRDLATAGIAEPAVGPRSLHGGTRHTFCTSMLEAGVPFPLLEAMSHASAANDFSGSCLRVYTHPSWPALCEQMLRLPYNKVA